MVFTKLSAHEKEAFFGLLDEYFQSRPELFGQHNEGDGLAGTGISTAAATSAVQRALATASSHAATASGGAGSGILAKSNNPYAANMHKLAGNVSEADVARVGRVAAASLAFSGMAASADPAPASASSGPGPALPRRTPTNVLASAPEGHVGLPGSEVDKLVSKKASVFNAFKAPPRGGAVIPPAFVQPSKGAFTPPPVRRVTSDAPVVTEGEWAEALYDYSSEDPADLAIEAGTRVFVTAKSSDDWWTGQVEGQGKEGLFPASYVKLL